jgi:hypothetical protein
VSNGLEWVKVRTAPPRCACPSCRLSFAEESVEAAQALLAQALLDSRDAHEDFINSGTEMEGNLYYLLDEVEAVLGAERWWQRRSHRALRQAYQSVRHPPTARPAATPPDA